MVTRAGTLTDSAAARAQAACPSFLCVETRAEERRSRGLVFAQVSPHTDVGCS